MCVFIFVFENPCFSACSAHWRLLLITVEKWYVLLRGWRLGFQPQMGLNTEEKKGLPPDWHPHIYLRAPPISHFCWLGVQKGCVLGLVVSVDHLSFWIWSHRLFLCLGIPHGYFCWWKFFLFSGTIIHLFSKKVLSFYETWNWREVKNADQFLLLTHLILLPPFLSSFLLFHGGRDENAEQYCEFWGLCR